MERVLNPICEREAKEGRKADVRAHQRFVRAHVPLAKEDLRLITYCAEILVTPGYPKGSRRGQRNEVQRRKGKEEEERTQPDLFNLLLVSLLLDDSFYFLLFYMLSRRGRDPRHPTAGLGRGGKR